MEHVYACRVLQSLSFIDRLLELFCTFHGSRAVCESCSPLDPTEANSAQPKPETLSPKPQAQCPEPWVRASRRHVNTKTLALGAVVSRLEVWNEARPAPLLTCIPVRFAIVPSPPDAEMRVAHAQARNYESNWARLWARSSLKFWPVVFCFWARFALVAFLPRLNPPAFSNYPSRFSSSGSYHAPEAPVKKNRRTLASPQHPQPPQPSHASLRGELRRFPEFTAANFLFAVVLLQHSTFQQYGPKERQGGGKLFW